MRAAARESCSSISASSPSTSGSSGISSRTRRRDGSPRRTGRARIDRGAGARRVALVEDEVEDAEHRSSRVGQLVGGGHPVRDAGRRGSCASPAPAAGPSSPRAPERAGDLGGRAGRRACAASARPGLRRERRMAAGEDEAQPVVRDLRIVAGRDVVLGSAAPAPRAARPCASRRARRRSRSMALLRATRGDPRAAGWPGRRRAGQCSSATTKASWTASSARSKSPSTGSGWRPPAPTPAEQAVDVLGGDRTGQPPRWCARWSRLLVVHDRPHLDLAVRHRVCAPRPEPRRGRRIEQVEPPSCSARLDEGTVGDVGAAGLQGDGGGGFGRWRPSPASSAPAPLTSCV